MKIIIEGEVGPQVRAASVAAGFIAFSVVAFAATTEMMNSWAECPAAVLLVVMAEVWVGRAALFPARGFALRLDVFTLAMAWLLVSSGFAAQLSRTFPFRGPFCEDMSGEGLVFDPSMGDRYHAGHLVSTMCFGLLMGFLLVVSTAIACGVAILVYRANLPEAAKAEPAGAG